MIRQGLGSDDGCFNCVKITLLIVHILGMIGAIIMMFVMISALIVVGTHKDTDQETRDELKTVGAFTAFLFSFMFLYELIAIIGIVRENKTIIITYLVLSLIGLVGNTFYGYQTGALTLLVIGLTAYYAHMLVKKSRAIV